MSKVTIFCNDEIEEKILVVSRQTDYTPEIAREKLKLHNNDEIKVIKEFMGVPEKKEKPIKSLNQEMYRQIRSNLDEGIKDWNIKQEEKVREEIQKLKEENN